jgi:hypothetical protein
MPGNSRKVLLRLLLRLLPQDVLGIVVTVQHR